MRTVRYGASTVSVAGERLAGVAVPLFSLRAEHDCGVGEFLDLLPFLDWAAATGLRIVALLPLGELAPGERSPYNALSSFALDPLHIAPGALPELSSGPLPAPPRGGSVFDREAARTFKEPLLAEAFARFGVLPGRDPRIVRFVAFHRRHRAWLTEYTLFRALAEEHGFNWREWPQALARHEPRALRHARAALAGRVAFFEYLQFAAEEQWQEVRARALAQGVLLLGDLPFAPSESSADVWAHPEAFDPARSVGAPPDAFSATGQRWGLPMPRWQAQRRSGWKWMRARARRMAGLYDLVRVDHVVGLFRTYAFAGDQPDGFEPAEPAEQVAQGREILRLLRRESAPACLVAEDLGVIPAFVPQTLDTLALPGFRVLRWERDEKSFRDPATYPECSITTTGTHDTDTLETWWRSLATADRRLLASRCGGELETERPDLSAADRRAILGMLLDAPSRYAVFPIQDLFGWSERINLPGTVGGENWTYRLPVDATALERQPELRAESHALRTIIDRSGRNRTMSSLRRG